MVPVVSNNSVLWKYEYNLKDHLGNVHVVFGGHGNGKPEVLQLTSYDPFGLVTVQTNYSDAENTLQNKYLYNGKELQDDAIAGTKLDWYDYGARFYDPTLGRFLSPDPYVQMPDFSQNLNRYSYCLNNPLLYTDPDGEWVHILIGALVGGIINTAVHWNQIDNFWDGLAAFGIGAAGGALTAATGGAALGAFGTAGAVSVGAGGFFGGAISTGMGYIAGSSITSLGNSVYFGDPLPSAKEALTGLGISMLTGGVLQGINASVHGRNFWNGNINGTGIPAPTRTPCPNLDSPTDAKVNTDGMRSQLNNMPQNNMPQNQDGFTLVRVKTGPENYSYINPAAKGGTNLVYQGVDKAGVVRYVGITERDAALRFGEHLSSGTARSLLRYDVVPGATNLTRMGARVWEQTLINQYGLGKNGGLLLNRINSIAPKNW